MQAGGFGHGFHEEIINRYSLAERVASLLRTAILTGELTSGTKLTETVVSKRYHTSATPVREAFRILQSEGLLVHSPYLGVVVAQITPKYIVDLCDMRCLLETGACDLIFENAEPSDLAEMERVIAELEALKPAEIKPDDTEAIEHFNATESEFHIALAAASKNVELLNVAKSLLKKAYLSRHMLVLNFSQTINILETVNEIMDMLAAIKARDKARLKAAIALHYDRQKEQLIRIAEQANSR